MTKLMFHWISKGLKYPILRDKGELLSYAIAAVYIATVFITTELFFYPKKFLVTGLNPFLQELGIVIISGFLLGISLTITFVLSEIRGDLNRVIKEYNEYFNKEEIESLPYSDARKIFVDICTQIWTKSDADNKARRVLPQIITVLISVKIIFLALEFSPITAKTYLETVVSSIRGAAFVWILVFLIYPGEE
jgi:hypothetical protein